MLDDNYFIKPMELKSAQECEPFPLVPAVFFDADDPLIRGAAEYFMRDMKTCRGVALTAATDPAAAGIIMKQVAPGGVKLPEKQVFAACAVENYRITAKDGGVVCEFCGIKGANRALATVFQNAQVKDGELFWKYSLAADGPSCDYRAMMIDLGRNFHPIGLLYEYVDMCFAYKLNYLHLHFSDTQYYTLPSRVFPALAEEGKSYTFEEIRALNKYALRRGVTIMPEIDLPGHCRAFQAAAPEIFGTDGIINLTEESLAGVCEVLREVCGMFPYSDLFHIGGDEAELFKWTKHKPSMDYFRTVDPETAAAYERDSHAENVEYLATTGDETEAKKQNEDESGKLLTERMLAHFISVCAQTVKDKGKRAVIWEGFNKCVNDRVSRDILVMSWENYYQTAPELLEAGFEIINCSWVPTYVVTPNNMWSPSRIRKTWDIFYWEPVHPGSPYIGSHLRVDAEKWRSKIHGGQLNAWGSSVPKDSPNLEAALTAEMYCVANRLPPIAHNVWFGVEHK